jgi:hypothetical protein
MPDTLREIRRAVAGLIRQPGLSATVVLTLAIAIGANTALFAYVCVFLWPTVDAPDPEELVNVGSPNENGWLDGLTHDDFRALEETRKGFERVAGSIFFNGSIRPLEPGPNDDAGPYFAWAHAVSGDYFLLYGARPQVGRLLRPDDDRPGAPRVAVIAYPFWRRHHRRPQLADHLLRNRQIVVRCRDVETLQRQIARARTVAVTARTVALHDCVQCFGWNLRASFGRRVDDRAGGDRGVGERSDVCSRCGRWCRRLRDAVGAAVRFPGDHEHARCCCQRGHRS